MPLRDYPRAELLRQPIGYWTGHTYRTVVGRIRSDLADEGLIQPTWWILNHVDGDPGAWNEEKLIDRLEPFDDQGTDFAEAFAQLKRRKLIHDGGSGLRLTERGEAVLRRARDRSAASLAQTMEGVSEDDYLTMLDVLRRIVDNLGCDSDLP